MSGRRRTIFFLVMLLAVLVLLTGQVRGEDRRSLGPLGTGVLTALAPLRTGPARRGPLGTGVPPPLAPLQTLTPRVADPPSRTWHLSTEGGRLRVENARLRE